MVVVEVSGAIFLVVSWFLVVAILVYVAFVLVALFLVVLDINSIGVAVVAGAKVDAAFDLVSVAADIFASILLPLLLLLSSPFPKEISR